MSELFENPMAYIGDKWEDIYKKLCKNEDSGISSVFDQMTSLFTLCASIGHLNQTSKKLEKSKGIFRWSNLNQEREVSVLTAIAWDSQGRDLSVLENKKRIMELACDYAEAGMQYLYDNFFEDHMHDGQLGRIDKLDVEFNLAQILEGLRQKQQNVFDL